MKVLRKLAEKICREAEVIDNPTISYLRMEAKRYAVPNKRKILLFHSKVRARSPEATIDNVNKLSDADKTRVYKEVSEVAKYLKGGRVIVIDRSIGTSERFSLKARVIVSAAYPHLALMFALNYFPAPEDKEPDIISIDVPEWWRKGVYVDPEENVSYILGLDYYGELKMSVLRLAMNHARDKLGMLGLHAGSKLYRVRVNGELREKGVLIFGLSGTGKTTITVIDHGLRHPEGVVIRQDDIVILDSEVYASGTEMNLYPKTDSVLNLPPLLKAVTHRDAVLENVAVKDGEVDFSDVEFCSNGRAIAIREAMDNSDGKIDLPRVDALIFLTKRREIPVLAMLTNPEQVVAYFMLGESMMTSAGTMRRDLIGRPIRVSGFDPFIIDPAWKNGLRLYQILKKNSWLKGYVLNTGEIGGVKVPIEVTMKAVLGLIREEVKWRFDENLKLYVAVEIPGVNLEEYDPYRIYGEEEYVRMVRELREERRKYLLEKFPQLKFILDSV